MMKNLFTIFLIGCILVSCKKEAVSFEPTPTFVVEHKEEKMPVWIHGNTNSNVVLLAVHGGPGSDVLDFRNYKGGLGFKQVEASLLVAYWQQRSAGQSQGSSSAHYTIDQYAEDLNIVVDSLKARYPAKKIVLLGHSWGGMLVSSYLKDAARKAKVRAWIDAAGVSNGTSLLNTTKDDLIDEANTRIRNNDNADYWTNVKNQVSADANKGNSLAYEVVDKIAEIPVKVPLTDFKFTERAIESNRGLYQQVLTTNNTAAIGNFNIPTLILWGKYDFAVSKKMRSEVLKVIPNQYVTSVEFPISGHYMMFHEPGLFATSIVNFTNTL